MSTKPLLLPEDPRWLEFCKEYFRSAERFAREVQGIDPSDQQVELFTLRFGVTIPHVSSVRARHRQHDQHRHGSLWHLLCYPMSVTLLTANDMDWLKATLWKEIGVALERTWRGPHGWVADHVEILANATCRIIGFEQVWFVESKTANEKTANKMAGRHGE